MVSSVIGFVFAYRNASAELLDFGLEHRLRGVAHVAELRLPPGRLAVKSAVGIGHARMRAAPKIADWRKAFPSGCAPRKCARQRSVVCSSSSVVGARQRCKPL